MKSLLSILVYKILSLRYEIEVDKSKVNLDQNKKTLILPNHPALIDPIILYSILQRKYNPTVLIDEGQFSRPGMGLIQKMIKMFPIPDFLMMKGRGKDKVYKTLNDIGHILEKSDNILLYPSGRIYREGREKILGTFAVEHLVNNFSGYNIMLIRTKGLWGSSFSRGATGEHPSLDWKTILSGALKILSNLVFFVPKRKVSIELVSPNDFPIGEEKNIINSYLEEFYNKIDDQNIYVPYYFWKKDQTEIRKSINTNANNDVSIVPRGIRKAISEFLCKELSISDVNIEDRISIELESDSLKKAEILAWIESEFGESLEDPEQIQTVADLMLLASGNYVDTSKIKLSSVSNKWFNNIKNSSFEEDIEFDNIGAYLIDQFKRAPDKILIADQTSGTKSLRDIFISIFVLRKFINKFEGDYIGIMLPASVASFLSYFSVIFSGKIPVMINWTAGQKNLNHSINSLSVKRVITSKILINKLEEKNIVFNDLKSKFFYLEDLANIVTLKDKLLALLQSYFSMGSLEKQEISETSAILFTSGSESNPKIVPLNHRNHIENCKGILNYVEISRDDKLLGVLPPFHSFGLIIDIVLPAMLGVPVVLYPNPLEASTVNRIVDLYRPTVTALTPTFLRGINAASVSKELESLRLVVVGAESLPPALRDVLNEKYPDMILTEGYGITECSPVVSVNPAVRNDKFHTIGKVLANLDYAIVDYETLDCRVDKGEDGMLIVRGDSIFDGYINLNGSSPFITFEGSDWYKTGDIVAEDRDRYIIFKGRMKRFVKIGGEMISLPAIESVLMKHLEQDDTPWFAVEAIEYDYRPEIVLVTTKDIGIDVVNKIIKDTGLGPLSKIRDIKKVDEIPLLGSGKTDYRTLKMIIST